MTVEDVERRWQGVCGVGGWIRHVALGEDVVESVAGGLGQVG